MTVIHRRKPKHAASREGNTSAHEDGPNPRQRRHASSPNGAAPDRAVN